MGPSDLVVARLMFSSRRASGKMTSAWYRSIVGARRSSALDTMAPMSSGSISGSSYDAPHRTSIVDAAQLVAIPSDHTQAALQLLVTHDRLPLCQNLCVANDPAQQVLELVGYGTVKGRQLVVLRLQFEDALAQRPDLVEQR